MPTPPPKWLEEERGQEKGEVRTPDTHVPCVLYCWFKRVKRFDSIFVEVDESGGALGLSDESLTDFAKLTFKESFAGIPYKPTSRGRVLAIEERAAHAFLWCEVLTTVGTNIVAYYVECRANNLDWDKTGEEWGKRYLGYSSKRNVPNTIKETIGVAIEDLAIEFFKMRGEL